MEYHQHWEVTAYFPTNLYLSLEEYNYNFVTQRFSEGGKEFVVVTFLYDAGRLINRSKALYAASMLCSAIAGAFRVRGITVNPTKGGVQKEFLEETLDFVRAAVYYANRSTEPDAPQRALREIETLLNRRQD